MLPLCPKAPASSECERDLGPCATEGTRRGVRCKAGRPPRPPAPTLARSPMGGRLANPGTWKRIDFGIAMVMFWLAGGLIWAAFSA